MSNSLSVHQSINNNSYEYAISLGESHPKEKLLSENEKIIVGGKDNSNKQASWVLEQLDEIAVSLYV